MAKLAYGRLSQYAGEEGECFPSLSTMAKETGSSRRTVIRAIEELESFGLIKSISRDTEKGGKASNVYIFLWHEIYERDLRDIRKSELKKQDGGSDKLALGGGDNLAPGGSDKNDTRGSDKNDCAIDVLRESLEENKDCAGSSPAVDVPVDNLKAKDNERPQPPTPPQLPKPPKPPKKDTVPQDKLRSVMLAFKIALGVDPNDKGWDKTDFSKWAIYGKELLIYFELDDARAIRCIEDVARDLNKGTLTWTPAAVCRWKADWWSQICKFRAYRGLGRATDDR